MGNREIKFRVWNTENKRWDNPSILEVWDDSGKLEPYSFIKTGKLNPVHAPVENFIIQQSTGLKDGLGREIYEGDLLARTLDSLPTYFEVYWNEPAAKFNTRLHRHHNKMIATYPIVADDYCNHEVIGNIFENPELCAK
jgi:uncharacterized phage protein (TIGR01671 family)